MILRTQENCILLFLVLYPRIFIFHNLKLCEQCVYVVMVFFTALDHIYYQLTVYLTYYVYWYDFFYLEMQFIYLNLFLKKACYIHDICYLWLFKYRHRLKLIFWFIFKNINCFKKKKIIRTTFYCVISDS